MRIALQFGRHDVDAFIDEIDHEDYLDWCEFFTLEPAGWQAWQHAITRLTFAVFQSQNARKLKEQDYRYEIRPPQSAAGERVRVEPMAIKARIEAEREARRGN